MFQFRASRRTSIDSSHDTRSGLINLNLSETERERERKKTDKTRKEKKEDKKESIDQQPTRSVPNPGVINRKINGD